jgi:group I intron endonuclease
MIKSITNISEIEIILQGVYKITNIINNKIYIGSTNQTFLKRLTQHYFELRKNNHKNDHLQYSWNKYGEDNFIFEIIEVTDKKETLEREQFWMDYYECYNKSIGFNINPKATGTPNLSKETIEKRRQTMLNNYKEGKIKPFFSKGFTPWNKGMKMSKKHNENLSNSAKKRICTKEGKKKRSDSLRKKSKIVLVYDKNNNFLGEWKNALELQEFSLTKENNLPIKGDSSKERKRKPYNYLSAFWIARVCNRKAECYKDLYFKWKD